MDTQIQLGDFVFQDLEIPEKINFGGSQQLVQHNLIGGGRVIDALGKNDIDITWSGLMTGPSALLRAQTLNKMRADGKQIQLKWFNLYFDVVIQNFEAQTEKYYQVTYTINLRVVKDGANPNSPQNLIGFNEAIRNDFNTANTIAQSVAIPAVTSAMDSVSTAIGNVSTFNGASPATISTVNTPLDTAILAVQNAYTDVKIALFGDSTGNL